MPENKPEKVPAAQAKTNKPAPGKRFIFTDEEVTLTLEYPITLGAGEQVIDRVSLRKPHASELRGLSLFEAMHLDMDSLCVLLPRITTPILHKPMIDELDPADLATIGKCITGFFTGRKQRATLIAEMEAAGAE